MKRAVIYARYSTDLQNDASVEDQIRICTALAERQGLSVVGEYHDRAKSGASMFGRPGLASMMQAAEHGAFEVVIAEAPDRLSRDIADLGSMHKMLTFRGIELHCVNGGKIDTMQVGLYGLVGQMQREEGAKKVRRGMVGVVQSGRSAGGRSYGYRPVPGKPGELEIVESEAEVIRRIFDYFAAGISPRTIAGKLNDEGVAPPRGTKWNASTINGNGARGYGILRNPLYAGTLVWNRVRMIKDPSTGMRVSRPNDEADFQRQEMPHLRIVSDEIYHAVQQRKEARGGKHAKTTAKGKRLLSGLLKCGKCGGGLSIVGADRSGPRVVCSTHKESGTCDNNARYYVEKIERKVIDTLRMQFADTDVIDAYVKEYEAEQKRATLERRKGRAAAEKGLQEAKDAISAVVLKLAKGLIEDDDAAAILPGLRAERERFKAELEAQEPEQRVIEIKPKAIEKFRESVTRIADILTRQDGEFHIDLMKHFRQVIAAVIVQPRRPGEEYQIEIKGYLSSLISPDLSAVIVVAGEGLEPPTRGL
ncbi:recombinase family protein [Metarhizobium album]|uniref:Recombinase family protein n=1 Tax=Metarhizobium album TaxID=2182425 RepID=A0A2U2DW97_9HYPH|nr:recombinase family protein [Rhizobium album]PWE57587.1 recombinase family protein [Rhizobium album]